MELWNEKLTRENISDFYQSTVEMVYTSVFDIAKETTRAEQAIVKAYIDTYQQRGTLKGEDVIYTFGDILLKNANEIVEKYPLPENVSFAPRTLDEYTRNFMLEKIIARIDSKSYKVAEFISSDSKKNRSPKTVSKVMDLLPVTPLLAIQLILLALIIWGVSTLAITVPYKKDTLVNESKIFGSVNLQEKYVTILDYYPLNAQFPVADTDVENPENPDAVIPAETDGQVVAPVVGTTAEPEISATRG
ncbi:MAG: hypothetical protein MJ108_00225 [Saccharofermentans sp.]|nr:hypothetical protein [Saccharofermentans sp.]